MSKCTLLCIASFIGNYFFSYGQNLSNTSLSKNFSEDFFKFKNDQEKEELNQKLIKQTIPIKELKFNGITLENLDLSNMHLRGIDLSGCTLNDVKLINTDLRETNIDKANLMNVNLKGAQLTDSIKVPDYTEDNKTVLFNLWANGTLEEQQCYQNLLNASFNLVRGVNPDVLRTTLEKKNKLHVNLNKADFFGADLRGINLNHVQLQGANLHSANLKRSYLNSAKLQNTCFFRTNLKYAHLKNAQLQNASLYGAKLQGAYLNNAQLQNTDLDRAYLQKTWLSDKVQIPNYPEENPTVLFNKWAKGTLEEQKCYQKLVNSKFNLFKKVNPHILRTTIEEKVKLNTDLSNANLSNINLKGICLRKARLQNADLRETNLQNAKLNDAQLQGAYLEGTNLKNADLRGAKLSKSFTLKYSGKDKELIKIHQYCKDQAAKKLLEEILISKGLKLKR